MGTGFFSYPHGMNELPDLEQLAYKSERAAGRRLGSRLASFVALSEVVASLVFAWLLLGELPRPVQLLGGLVILAGVVMVKLDETGEPRKN